MAQLGHTEPLKGRRNNPLLKWGVALALIVIAAIVALGWLPIVKSEGREAQVVTASRRTAQVTDLTKDLTRTGLSSAGTTVDVILASFDFFRATGRLAEARELKADKFLVFVANETVHYGDLPHHFSPILRIDNNNVRVATETRVLNDSVHHRTSVLIFEDVPQSILNDPHTIEILLGDVGNGQRNILEFYTPIDYPDSVEGPPPMTLSLLLTLAAGLLAAISPCLLQLTAFYLPTMAGISVDKTTGSNRGRVLGTAFLFVLGFTIPYTIGGAAMGGFGQALTQTGLLTPTGPLAIVSGAVMIAMAGFVAWRARAPIVCKMPMPGIVSKSKRLPMVETFVSGFAIATGCLACFGGAILGVLLVYTGLLGSPLLGGLSMFVFSLGIAIPFMLAALSLSWVLPLAQKLQRATPIIGLVSAAVMLFFGLTMITGNFHVVSGILYQLLPLS